MDSKIEDTIKKIDTWKNEAIFMENYADETDLSLEKLKQYAQRIIVLSDSLLTLMRQITKETK